MMAACWEAFENPFASFLRIVFYLKGESPEARTESINEAASNMLALHGMLPSTSHWIKVVDTETGKLIGAANWMTHESSPYTEPRPPTVAVWWPEGDGRDYASNYMQQVEAHKPRYYDRPHVYLNISFTIPEWRRRGAGKLMMEWGVKKADEMNVPSFVEASESGTLLYEKFGFMTFGKIDVNTEKENASAEWKRLQKELPPDTQYLMWRPVQGAFILGQTSLPWESKPFVPMKF
ncbi:hypothetical protein CJF30_00001284 [Rutstroemia sp. NJR-2017a BBW]|nr:hypothetical protein CJF30_00001284 [Rutstroemia sp. NJR-2017a BBW]